MDYTVALVELDNWSEDIAKFVYYLRNLDFAGTDTDRYHARNDMLLMIQLFCQCLEKLHRESTVCRQRKKTTPNFKRLYRRATEHQQTVENNRVMYSLMFG
jgi:hypothetical protein